MNEIKIENIEDLVQMANQALGMNYLDVDYFNKVINSPVYYSWIIFSETNQPIAFLVAYKTSKQEIQNYLTDFSLSNQLDENTVCFDTMVVLPNERNKGIGKELIKNAISYFPKNSYIMYAWKNKKIINMESIARFFNFKVLKEYPKLWEEDCLANKFSCPAKEEGKCSCSTVVYYFSPIDKPLFLDSNK